MSFVDISKSSQVITLNNICERSIKCFMLTLFVVLFAYPALATNYECKTEQELQWVKGRLIPDRNLSSWAHALIQFNDETGDFWTEIDKDSSPNPLPLKVIEKMSPDGELFAIYDETIKIHTPTGKILNSTSEGSSLRIRGWDRGTGLTFLFYSTSVNSISTGKCHIYNQKIPPVVRNK